VKHAAWWLCLLVLCGPRASASQTTLDLARRLAAEDRLEEALAVVDRALEEDPGSAEARLLRGVVLIRVGRLEEAETVLEALAAERPEAVEPRNDLAVIHARRGELERARQLLRQAIAADSVFATLYRNLGVVERRLAAQAYERALGEGGPDAAPDGEPLELLGESFASRAEPSVEAEAPPPAFDAAEVVSLVAAWARAWQDGQVGDYAACYTADFPPAAGGGREAWAAARLAGDEGREIRVEDVAARSLGDGRAQARFDLVRRGGGGERSSRVVLELARDATGWRIAGETIEPR
jgi:tetratricopeptide (TPR) repeat protein